MNDQDRIEAAIREATGSDFAIETRQAIGGGCINDAFQITGSGKSFFIKSNRTDFLDAFSSEADALREIADTETVRVPQVAAIVKGDNHSYLILEYIPTRVSRSGDWEALGRQLAALHEKRKPCYGWSRDNLIGATPQPNPRSDNWIDFFREHRLEHQLRLCHSRGYTIAGADELLPRLDTFFEGHQPWPSLLHGDLWSGNVAFDENGRPFLFDPASYYGDREADLAFTEFFGGFSSSFYDAYNETLPLDSGYSHRKILYNLYHCLNHLYLFGASYAYQAETMTRRLLEI